MRLDIKELLALFNRPSSQLRVSKRNPKSRGAKPSREPRLTWGMPQKRPAAPFIPNVKGVRWQLSKDEPSRGYMEGVAVNRVTGMPPT